MGLIKGNTLEINTEQHMLKVRTTQSVGEKQKNRLKKDEE